MPFTPFHLGPGALFKAIGDDRFSFMIFGGSQVLMDVEPLIRMMRGDAVLHGLSHTVVGAFLLAVASAALGRPISNMMLRYSAVGGRPVGCTVALISAFVGTCSHIALDAVMHPDMNPLWPFALGNGLLGLISVANLHWLCIASGLLGGVVAIPRALRRA